MPTSEIVIWQKDIWKAAAKGCEAFEGTIVSQELIDSLIPMFWQWDTDGGLELLAVNGEDNPLQIDVDCLLQGFVISVGNN